MTLSFLYPFSLKPMHIYQTHRDPFRGRFCLNLFLLCICNPFLRGEFFNGKWAWLGLKWLAS